MNPQTIIQTAEKCYERGILTREEANSLKERMFEAEKLIQVTKRSQNG
jgi:hypothetical protein